MIDSKSFFDVPIKNKEKTCEKTIEMSRNNYYTKGNLLDYEYFSNNYKRIIKDLSKQVELEVADKMQQISSIGILERNEGAAMFFIIEKTEETTFNLKVSYKMETLKIINLLNGSRNEESGFATKNGMS